MAFGGYVKLDEYNVIPQMKFFSRDLEQYNENSFELYEKYSFDSEFDCEYWRNFNKKMDEIFSKLNIELKFKNSKIPYFTCLHTNRVYVMMCFSINYDMETTWPEMKIYKNKDNFFADDLSYLNFEYVKDIKKWSSCKQCLYFENLADRLVYVKHILEEQKQILKNYFKEEEINLANLIIGFLILNFN
jgi:hypothetical protein